MLRAFIVCFGLAVLGSSAFADFQVAGSGHPNCVIVIETNAAPAEKRAANELSDYLRQISGANIPVLQLEQKPKSNFILVGRGSLAHRLFPAVKWNSLGEEQTVVTGDDTHLLVTGGSPRGTLYSAYRLLGRLGVRWWAPWATDVPKQPELLIPTDTVIEKPGLEYRDPSFYSEFTPEWATHNFCNEGPSTPEFGGGVTYEGFVHTYDSLVPPSKYFKTHPEWYSLIKGKRTAVNAQLCTTNPEMRKVLLAEVKHRLRANPRATIVSVSQNDCFDQCECPVCQSLAKLQGSQSAPVIALANYVAENIKKEFPHVAVDTLAYQWSRHAPKSLKPLPNVIVRLCSIECDFGLPLDAPKNQDFAKDVKDWNRLTNRLYVWDYVTNFSNYLEPMPDEAILGPNLAFLSANGVKGVFEEGDYTSNGGAMSELKAWVLARLLWNPKDDGIQLMREFTAGYFGAAAGPINDYLTLLDQAAAKTACTINQDSKAPYLTPENVFNAEALWEDAEQKVTYDPQKLWRVREAHLAIRYVILNRWDELRKYAEDHQIVWPLTMTKDDLAGQWLVFATSPGPTGWDPIKAVNEDKLSPKQFIDSLK